MRINAEPIREYREKHGISIDEMAEILHLDGEKLYDYESGGIPWIENDPMTIFILNSLIDDLDFISVDMDEVFRKYGQ